MTFNARYTVCALAILLGASPAQAQNNAPVQTLPAAAVEKPRTEEVRVQLTPEKEARMLSRMSGVVDEVSARDGQTVKKGDVIAHIACTEREQLAAQARARMEKQIDLANSAKKLVKLGSGSKVDMQVRIAEEAEARASYELARTEAAYCTIEAPFDGRVASLNVKAFQTVRDNDLIAEVLQDDTLQAEMIVPSRWLAWIREGLDFKIRVDETGREYDATITHFGGRVDPVSQSIKVYAVIPARSPELLAGMGGIAVLQPPQDQP